MEQQQFEVKTPRGVIRAIESPDKNNPGIIIMLVGNDGKEKGSCVMQYIEQEMDVKASLFGPDTLYPENDPLYQRWLV